MSVSATAYRAALVSILLALKLSLLFVQFDRPTDRQMQQRQQQLLIAYNSCTPATRPPPSPKAVQYKFTLNFESLCELTTPPSTPLAAIKAY